uniref:Uncharacterized protein n=1 Tax=Arundo donax TaxID=35708 RepID=A0A0A9AYC3_ARUDO
MRQRQRHTCAAAPERRRRNTEQTSGASACQANTRFTKVQRREQMQGENRGTDDPLHRTTGASSPAVQNCTHLIAHLHDERTSEYHQSNSRHNASGVDLQCLTPVRVLLQLYCDDSNRPAS